VMESLDVSCLATDLPEFITVDLSTIDVGHSIHVNDLTLPKGVTAITHGKNFTIATAAVPAGHVSAEATAAVEAPAAKPAKGKK
jgi:large subunit ribosomal protein L25